MKKILGQVILGQRPRALFTQVLCIAMLLGCNPKPLEPLPEKTNDNLSFFGFTLVDVGFDDPTDWEAKTSYLVEVAGFTNVADVLVIEANADIREQLEAFGGRRMKAVLHLHELFFEKVGEGGDRSGVLYGLRSDYQQRWDAFRSFNELDKNQDLIHCFYLGEEPAWNGISESEFTNACDYVKQTIPAIPILSIEAYPVVDALYAPPSVDWIGFDHYFIARPASDAAFAREYASMKSRMLPHQQVCLIMDAHFLPIGHGVAGLRKRDMHQVARDYYTLANADTTVVGILGYHWPSGFERRSVVGARHMPRHVLEEYQRIGKTIID